MLNKSVLFLLMFSLIFSSIFNTTARAESKKLFEKHNIQVVSDTDELKEIRVNSLTENSTYIVKIQKQDEGNYIWTSQISAEQEILYENSVAIESIVKDFSAKKWSKALLAQEKGNEKALEKFYDQHLTFSESTSNANEFGTMALPMLAALAIYGLTASQIAALETALYVTVTAVAAVATVEVLNEKKNTSTLTAPVSNTFETVPKMAEFTDVPTVVTTHGQRHMEQALTIAIANRIKNSDNSTNNLEVYASTADVTELKTNVMVVYDVKASLSGKVNRHLANVLEGTKVDSNYPDTTIDLNGYTVFLIYNHSSKRIFHAHFVPTADREVELKYMRYKGQFDLKFYPSVSRNTEYLKNFNRSELDQQRWEQRYSAGQSGRNLIRTAAGRKSVVPFR
jgi:hypothetical protein